MRNVKITSIMEERIKSDTSNFFVLNYICGWNLKFAPSYWEAGSMVAFKRQWHKYMAEKNLQDNRGWADV